MQKLALRSLIFAAGSITALQTGLVHAETVPGWVNSYSANGSCYCVGSIPDDRSAGIFPTPVGGQTVAQICNRLGKGPGLAVEGGIFNHPAFLDYQCGHGPMPGSGDLDNVCPGTTSALTPDASCSSTGPKWDLRSAYSSQPQAQATTADSSTVIETVPVAKMIETQPVPESVDDLPLAEFVDEPAPIQSTAQQPVAVVKTPHIEKSSDDDGNIPLATIVSTRVIGPETTATTTTNKTVVRTEPVIAEAPKSAPEPVKKKPVQVAATTRPIVQPVKKHQITPQKQPQKQPQIVAKAPESNPATIKPDVTAPETLVTEKQIIRPVIEPAAPAQSIASSSPVTTDDESLPNNEIAPMAQQADDSPIIPEISTDAVAKNTATPAEVETTPATATALRTEFRNASRSKRHYVELSPVNYDHGGAGGFVGAKLAGKGPMHILGRAAVAETYAEYMAGIGLSVRPSILGGAMINLLLGMEYGNFDLGITDYTDQGAMFTSSLGFDFDHRIHLEGGVSYSSFYEGDPSLFGAMLLRMTPTVNLSGRMETGDNDQFSLGLRFNF